MAVLGLLGVDPGLGGQAGQLCVDPGVGGQAGQLQPVPGTDGQAGLHQALAGDRHPGGEVKPAAADGLVTLEWNITADHVVQEDAQAPHCQLVSVVTFLDNPLRGRVDSRACTQHFVPKQNNSANNLPS